MCANFQSNQKKGETAKLKKGWSLPLKITKKINNIFYELEASDWSLQKFKVLRSQTHMNLFRGNKGFTGTRKRYNPTDFMSRHEFELIEEDKNRLYRTTSYFF